MTEAVKLGIKETKEALIGVNEISLLIAERLKDGAQLGDAVAVWDKLKTDPEFKAKVMAAYDNYQAIPAEIKDIDLQEGIELAGVQLSYVPKLVASFKKAEEPAPAVEAPAQA